MTEIRAVDRPSFDRFFFCLLHGEIAATEGTMKGLGPASGQRSFARAVLVSCLLATGGVAAPASAATGWVDQIAGAVGIDDPVRAIALDPSGDVVAASRAAVVKYKGADGAARWRIPVASTDDDSVSAVAVDRAGNLVVLEAHCCATSQGYAWDLVARSGVDGRVRWRFSIPDSIQLPLHPLVDASGDVVVVGETQQALAAVKVNGSTGTQEWLVRLPGIAPQQVSGAAMDANGDVVAVGAFLETRTAQGVLTKIAGLDGSRVWRTVLEAGTGIGAVAFDASGDLLAAGGINPDASSYDRISVLIMKVADASGDELWRDATVRGSATGLVPDAAGGAVVIGTTSTTSSA